MKRLIASDLEFVNLRLVKDDAVLLLLDHEGNYECLLLSSGERDFLPRLEEFENIIEYKFIGSEIFFELLNGSALLWRNDCRRKVILEEETEIIYFPKNGKVRFERKNKLKKDQGKENSEANLKRVLVIDDSPTIRKLLAKVISNSKSITIMAKASCPSEARRIIEREKPDLITLDIHMPEMNGVEFLKSYLKNLNIPVVMISSVSLNEGPLVLDALSNGAQTYIQKPSLENLSIEAPLILEQLENIALSNVKNELLTENLVVHPFSDLTGLIAIGSSTGGTQALETIFRSLPPNIPPIVVAQHIPTVFSKAFADRLNTFCPFTVKEAEHDEIIQANTIYIAPGGKQFRVLKEGDKKKVEISDDESSERFRPSIDWLFNSLAKFDAEGMVAAILTGMGKDGAEGLLNLKNSGAMTLAQDEGSSVVFGMPKEAVRIGAAGTICPLGLIAGTIVVEYNKQRLKKTA